MSAAPFDHLAAAGLVNLERVLALTGYCRSTLYAAMLAGLMTRPVKLGRASRWPEDEAQAVRAAILRGDDDGARRALVRQLHARRGAPQLRAV